MVDELIEEGFRRGILKTTRENVRMIKSRTTDEKGRIVEGADGERLKEKKLEEVKYYERNGK